MKTLMWISGKVMWFNDAKGYGFIECDGGHKVMVHFRDVEPVNGYQTLTEGEWVTLQLAQSAPGKPLHAKSVLRFS